jgi:putative oxidoreductase
MRKLPLIARILMGLIFVIFGLNGFLNFIPTPPEMPEKLTAFTTGMLATGYFFPFLKGMEVLCGLLLLSGRFVPLALVVLAPIITQIFLVHLFLAPSGLPVALVLGGLEIYLAFFVSPNKEVIRPLFRNPKKSRK